MDGVWIALGVAVFVVIVAGAGFVPFAGRGSLVLRPAIAGDCLLATSKFDRSSIETVGSGCDGTGGYSDITLKETLL